MKLPSVTEALSPWQDFSRVRPDVLEEAKLRGSLAHGLFAAYALCLWIPAVPDNCVGYFDSFKTWFSMAVEKTLAVEKEMVCKKYGFIGHPDWIGIIKGDRHPTLIDWKTGQTQMKAHRLQIAAYHHLAEETYGVKRVLLMHPKPNGAVAKVVEHTGTIHSDFATFLNCLSAYCFFMKD